MEEIGDIEGYVSDSESDLRMPMRISTHSSRHVAEPDPVATAVVDAEKRELLEQLDRMQNRGVRLHRTFNMHSNIEDMRYEVHRVRKSAMMEGAVGFQRNMLVTFVSGIEFLNDKFDPCGAKLTGWSRNVSSNLSQYDDIFEELFEKYS